MRLFRYIILLGLFLSPIYSQCDGDSNLDNSVSILDVVLIISHVLENDSLNGLALSNSDTNNDQEVDVLDIIVIIILSLSIVRQCVCEKNCFPLCPKRAYSISLTHENP